MILVRCLLVWLLLLVAAIGNGGIRERILEPRMSPLLAHQLSCVLLSAMIWGLTWSTIGWIGTTTPGERLGVGALWVALTVLFEFAFGRFGRGLPWHVLLSDYDVFRGRLFLLCLLSALLAPVVTARL